VAGTDLMVGAAVGTTVGVAAGEHAAPSMAAIGSNALQRK
jgi:hypothetical protein